VCLSPTYWTTSISGWSVNLDHHPHTKWYDGRWSTLQPQTRYAFTLNHDGKKHTLLISSYLYILVDICMILWFCMHIRNQLIGWMWKVYESLDSGHWNSGSGCAKISYRLNVLGSPGITRNTWHVFAMQPAFHQLRIMSDTPGTLISESDFKSISLFVS
jgi:hypothetical protein